LQAVGSAGEAAWGEEDLGGRRKMGGSDAVWGSDQALMGSGENEKVRLSNSPDRHPGQEPGTKTEQGRYFISRK